MSRLDWQLIGRLFDLTGRETKEAQMLFAGRDRESIAGELRKSEGSNLSPETVRVYIDRLFVKLNVSSTAQMVQRVLRVLWQKSNNTE